MMFKTFLFGAFALAVLCTACKKDEVPAPAPPAPQSSLIIHKIVNPYFKVGACDSLVPDTGFYLPSPMNTLLSYNFDLDSNGVNDLKVEGISTFEYFSPIVQQLNYQSDIVIASTDPSFQFAFSSETYVALLTTGDTINAEAFTWADSGTLIRKRALIFESQTFTGTRYVAYRQQMAPGLYRYGWISFNSAGPVSGFLYTISDWAWETAINRSIRAGYYW